MADPVQTFRTQKVVVIRHGERIDHVDHCWVQRSERPYDPPLTEQGVREAKEAGQILRGKVGLQYIICGCILVHG